MTPLPRFSESDSVRHNLELWLVGEEKLDLHALYDELHRRYPDMALRSPTNYAAHLLAAVMEYEAVVPLPPQRDTVSLPDVDHLDCTDKAPCGPRCPSWEVVLSDAQLEQMRELVREREVDDMAEEPTWIVGTGDRPTDDDWTFGDEHDAMNFAHNDYRLIGKRITVWRREGMEHTVVHRMAR